MTYSNYDCVVQINGTGISGASVSSFSHDQDVEQYKALGLGYLGASPKGYSVVTFSVTKPLCIDGGDPLKYLTGEDFCSGGIKIGGSGLYFTTGYLSKYSVKYSLDEAPNATMDFMIYGDTNWRTAPDLIPDNETFYFNSLGLTNIDFDGYSGIITSFDYQIEIPRKPIYEFGQVNPVAVKTMGPRMLTVNAHGYVLDIPRIEPNLYHSSGVMDFFNFSINTYGSGDTLVLLDSQTGSVNVNSNSVSTSIDDEMEFELKLNVCF